MSDQIGDLIFDNDSTLFKVLNTLEIPELATQIEGVQNQIDFVSDQTRQLGLIVDRDRSDATAAIIAVNTKVDLINVNLTNQTVTNEDLYANIANARTVAVQASNDVRALETTVSNLSTNQAITNEDLYSNVTNARNVAVQATNDVRALEITVANLSTLVSGFNTRISLLENLFAAIEIDVGVLTTKTNRIDTEVTLAKADILISKSDITILKRIPGCVTPGVDYTVCNRASGNQWIRTFRFTGSFGGRLLWGNWYTCTIDGVTNFVKLIDPMGFMTESSAARVVTTAVNYTRIWYGLTTNSITYAEVYFTPRNL